MEPVAYNLINYGDVITQTNSREFMGFLINTPEAMSTKITSFHKIQQLK